MTENIPELPVNKVAFVIDGEVVDILYAHDRLEAILLSNPTIVDITDVKNNSNGDVRMGDSYNKTTKKFSTPAVGS